MKALSKFVNIRIGKESSKRCKCIHKWFVRVRKDRLQFTLNRLKNIVENLELLRNIFTFLRQRLC